MWHTCAWLIPANNSSHYLAEDTAIYGVGVVEVTPLTFRVKETTPLLNKDPRAPRTSVQNGSVDHSCGITIQAWNRSHARRMRTESKLIDGRAYANGVGGLCAVLDLSSRLI